ncbi:MAG: UbiD family decarboxylase [Candidatus Omnitrophica bacterium]|nr:UbiD family decarboxylase [Candidatus Omnitrophota bacterium]
MIYRSLEECVLDLEKNGQLVRIREEVDPNLEMAEIHRRVYQAGGPAVLYERVKGSPFRAVSNLFGTMDRARFLFRHTLQRVQKLVRLKADPMSELADCFVAPAALLAMTCVPFTVWNALPKKVSNSPILENRTQISGLPQIKCWPEDAGPFVLMGQVYTENPDAPGIMKSNLGMYRLQMAGNHYRLDKQIGMHYQIRRDIGIHHTAAVMRGEKLRVSVFVGGPPAHSFAAVMYLPEGFSEVAFAGALAGRRFRHCVRNGFVISTDADFCITGFVEPGKLLPEGPFGDHLGYYSLKHDFPVLEVETVYHRKNAIWPFTVVGRPPQEDTVFGKLVQEIAGPMIPKEIPGIKAVHAVDAAGVHPLLLAIGSERYAPYQTARTPQEILALASALLGYGPLSLAKYLLIAAGEDNPNLDIHDIQAFLAHVLERVDWRRDLHFQTCTTMDTLDYSGTGLSSGSKVVVAARGKKIRELSRDIPSQIRFPGGFEKPKLAIPGVIAVQGKKFEDYESAGKQLGELTKTLERQDLKNVPLIVLADDSEFMAKTLNNFLWMTFTRSNPSHDIYGIVSFTEHKHWGCRGPLVIDARMKPNHAPPLIEDPAAAKKVSELGAPGRPLHGII